jgi:regulator of sigma E protease
MAGETADEPRTGAPDEFLSKTKWQRFQVLIMGPVMNLALAVVVMAIVLTQGAERSVFLDEPPVVGFVTADSPAERAGIRAGDRIATVAGTTLETWEDLELNIGTRPGRDVPVSFVREGQTIETVVHPIGEGRFEIGQIGISPKYTPVVRSLEKGQPAEQAGVKPGDELLGVNGQSFSRAEDLRPVVEKSAGRPLELTLRRNGEVLRLTMTPAQRPEGPRIGLTPDAPSKIVKLGPIEAIRESVKRNYEMSGMIFQTLGGLFTGETSVRQLQGPVGIAQLSGESAQAGWVALLSLLAVISLNLGILNLMPVPILDGGHILIMALEGIARRDFSMQAKEKMLFAGFVVLMMLMVTVIYNDLTRISSVERLMPWRN